MGLPKKQANGRDRQNRETAHSGLSHEVGKPFVKCARGQSHRHGMPLEHRRILQVFSTQPNHEPASDGALVQDAGDALIGCEPCAI